MATPVVAGVAGLVWSANPELNHLEVKQILMDSVDLIPDLGGKVISEGRINAETAVRAARGGAIPDSEPDSGTEPDPETDDDYDAEEDPDPVDDPESNTDSEAEPSGSDSGGGCFISKLVL